jgi:vacuolar protein sorting-associated protein 45
MVESAAEHFPTDIYSPPSSVGGTSTSLSNSTSSTPAPAPGTPGLNLRAGGYELSVGGNAGSGLYRTQEEAGASVNIGAGASSVAEGLRDGAGRLWGSVRARVEERVSRTGTPLG